MYNEVVIMDYLTIYHKSNFDINILIPESESYLRERYKSIFHEYIKVSTHILASLGDNTKVEYNFKQFKFLELDYTNKKQYLFEEFKLFKNQDTEA